METYLPVVCLAVLLGAFLVFFLIGKDQLTGLSGEEGQPTGWEAAANPKQTQPDPISENPEVAQKLLQILKDNVIYFDKFGKITRVHGQLIYGIKIKAEKQDIVWAELTRVLPPAGYWPVFVSQDSFEIEHNPPDIASSDDPQPADIIRRAKKYPIETYLIKIEDMLADRLDQIAKGEYWGNETVPDPDNAPPQERWTNPSSLLAFIPTPHSWQTPAFLTQNNTLQLTDEEVLVVLAQWEELYGAKMYFFTPNVMVLITRRRPETKEEALQLAFEHANFCGELFKTRYLNPEDLAADSMRSNTWIFKWA